MQDKYNTDELIDLLTLWGSALKKDTNLFIKTQMLFNELAAAGYKKDLLAKTFGLQFEDLFKKEFGDKNGLGYFKREFEDPNYVADSNYGDFQLRLFNYIILIDTKISTWTQYLGSIQNMSLNNFGGWYLCFSKDLSKICLIDSTYFRSCINIDLNDSNLTEEERALKLAVSNCYLGKDYEHILEPGIKRNAVIIIK